jgi:hypothetical protein
VGYEHRNCTGKLVGAFSQAADCIYVGGQWNTMKLVGPNQVQAYAYSDSKCTQNTKLGAVVPLNSCFTVPGEPGFNYGANARWIYNSTQTKARMPFQL